MDADGNKGAVPGRSSMTADGVHSVSDTNHRFV